MNVLILGATGFVGSYLMERAIAAGHAVLGTHYNATIDSRDWASYQDRLQRCDIRYREQVDVAIRRAQPDVIYLLAAQSYPALSWQVPAETLDTNVVGTANVYEAIRASGLDPVVVVACSSAQYGEVAAEDIPVRESHPMRPLHPSGVSKVATELLALQYHANAGIRFLDKIERSIGQDYIFPHVRKAITDAWKRADLPGVSALNGIELHDCFTSTEYMAIDHFGFTAPGQSWRAIEDGVIAMGGACPVNASGGLIGVGHPVGATGARMLLDAGRQVTGTAGDYQVEGARTYQTLNIGGSLGTVVSFVVVR